MKTKTKVFLLSGIAMIAMSLIVDIGIFRMMYNEYWNNIEKCSPYRIDSSSIVNQTTARAKIDKLLELQQQNPAAFEAMQQQCESNEKTLIINLEILLWIIFILLIGGIALVIVAIVMIIKDRRSTRRQQQNQRQQQ
jgi:hypothetical protein